VPVSVIAARFLTRLVPRSAVPFWAGVALDTLDQRPAPLAAAVHGVFFGRIAPPSRRRRRIQAPALVVGHPRDLLHPAADAELLVEELPHARFVAARSILEWRVSPARLDAEAVAFVDRCWSSAGRRAALRLEH
jgi:pimeloyl-ACP methyl ester carboxylesterase